MARCSASTASPAAASVAAIRSGCTKRPASRSVVWAPATTVRRARSRSGAHSACQPPSARSSTWPAAARCKVAANIGVVSAARRTSTDNTGLALSGIVDDGPPAASDSSPISGRDRVSTSLAIRPQASVQRTRASPARVTVLRTVCQAGASARPRSPASRARAASGSSPSSTAAAIVPAAPPTCTGKVRPDRSSYASRTAVSHVATLRPKVVGTACWVRVRATVGVPRCSHARLASQIT